MQKYSTTVLSAMMSGMDDKDDIEDDITLEAMEGLSKILKQIDENHIRFISMARMWLECVTYLNEARSYPQCYSHTDKHSTADTTVLR